MVFQYIAIGTVRVSEVSVAGHHLNYTFLGENVLRHAPDAPVLVKRDMLPLGLLVLRMRNQISGRWCQPSSQGSAGHDTHGGQIVETL